MTAFGLTNQSNLFKIKYLKLSENVYNSYNFLLGRVNKTYDFVGKQALVAIPTGFGGGVGSGTLPTANISNVENAIITAKRVYGVCNIEREAIKAAETDEGSFVRQTKWSVQKTVESYMRNMERIWWNDGTGALDKGDGATNVTGNGTTATPYVVTLNTSWREANWEERDYVNYDTETSLLEVVAVDPSTRKVSLVGTSVGLAALTGAGPVPTTKYFYMQGSKGNDPMGLIGALSANSGTLYGVTVGRRWQAYQDASGGAGISTDVMNKDMLNVEKRCGKVPNLIATGYTQFQKILNLLEDQKQYIIEPKSPELKGKVSFKGVEFMSSAGPVPIFPARFCPEDTIVYLNDNFLTTMHRPGFGWFEDDGTVFLRSATKDEYEARYGGYMENYIVPTFHGIRTGLAI